MTEDSKNAILEQLRQLGDGLADLRHDTKDLKFRVNAIERSLAGVHDTLAHHSGQFDAMSDRQARIEKRLDLVEP